MLKGQQTLASMVPGIFEIGGEGGLRVARQSNIDQRIRD
jgi:hypothetical protein